MIAQPYYEYLKGPTYPRPFPGPKKRSSSIGRNFRIQTNAKLHFDRNDVVNRAKIRIDSEEIQIRNLQSLEPLSHLIDDKKLLSYIDHKNQAQQYIISLPTRISSGKSIPYPRPPSARKKHLVEQYPVIANIYKQQLPNAARKLRSQSATKLREEEALNRTIRSLTKTLLGKDSVY